MSKMYLVKVSRYWRSEMIISGARSFTWDELKEYMHAAQQSRAYEDTGFDDGMWNVGTNQYIHFDDFEDLLSALRIYELTESQHALLKCLHLANYGEFPEISLFRDGPEHMQEEYEADLEAYEEEMEEWRNDYDSDPSLEPDKPENPIVDSSIEYDPTWESEKIITILVNQ